MLLSHQALHPYFLPEYCLNYFAPVTATDLLASSLPAIITFLHIITRYFKEHQEKALTGKSFALCNQKLMIHYITKITFKGPATFDLYVLHTAFRVTVTFAMDIKTPM